ncbi:hypothetical protein ROHU_029209 [Labeo rohita]|uniref:Uncharacterized protein n=1 Tax=Labeo rohita TaxID=84645 RepID=A0A498LWY0_LABRO|nr:hypothetical protein ROHU_029209 [Labeo rohita]
MVTEMSYDPVCCLEVGMAKLKFFRTIKYWDKNRNLKAKWNFKDFIKLHQPSQIPSAAARVASYRGDVCVRIKGQELSFSRSVKKYRENGLPWLEVCIDLFFPRGMPKDRLISALVYLSCVGMVQNDDFVSFQKLSELEKQLPVTQRHLQQLRILSQLMLIQSPQVWQF